ncbi:3'-5' exonuclease [Sporosarcina sp. YIM B06819]|uniref:3'-5' exonuclease n=1 Tax=Sporosarcina sp. YIM B06819 TaxID=3081769 RepID=UPI00298CC1C2|nr:3'-5' exonuclease [Sporosarcina sp. YIM B06819]
MAIMIDIGKKRVITAGERQLHKTLQDYLPDDYIVYFEPEILNRRPDFVIIGPDIGIVVLEVKDWNKSTILNANKDDWMIFGTNGQQAIVDSPYKQAEQYGFKIIDFLKQEPLMKQQEGPFMGHLKMPVGWGTVFTRLDSEWFSDQNLYSIIPPEFCLCRDEIDPEHEHFSEEMLMEKLMNMFRTRFRLTKPLTDEEVQFIRYKFFPEVRISTAQIATPAVHEEQILLTMHNLKTMDIVQEKLARTIGDQHRIIRGVAGSGKTIILATRAALLARENPDWRILVLCFNIPLAKYLNTLVQIKVDEIPKKEQQASLFEEDKPEANGSIDVSHFHEFLKKHLNCYHDAEIPAIIEAIANKERIAPRFDAILIDEGQDFEPAWLQLISQLLNPTTKSMLIVEDRAQNIYKRKTSYLNDTGLDFRGRSNVLAINYRNTKQILEFAWNFYKDNTAFKDKVAAIDINGEIIAPRSTRHSGPDPHIYKADTFINEMDWVSRTIHKMHETHHIPYEEMLILYRVKYTSQNKYIDIMKRKLQEYQVPFHWIAENRDAKNKFSKLDSTVKISTLESSKGLDFQAVFIVNIDNMPFARVNDPMREAALLYIGMTRAQRFLTLSYSGVSEFTVWLEKYNGLKDEMLEKKKALRGS